jgi:exosortase/archaeosortase family protein
VSGLCSGLRALSIWTAVAITRPRPVSRRALLLAVGALAVVPLNAVRLAHLFQLGAARSPRFALYHEQV